MRLDVQYHGERVGELLQLDRGAWFQYDRDWLGRGLELSPFNLATTSQVLGPWDEPDQYYLAGLFADSLPDNYGNAVILRRFKDAGLAEPSPLEMLAYLGARTMGALTYAPSSGEPDANRKVDLIEAARSARQVVEYDFSAEVDTEIIASGGSAGGAQPKILVSIDEDNQRLVTGSDHIPDGMGAWLLKLAIDGPGGAGLANIEHAYFLMSHAAGIDSPDTKLIRSQDGATHFAIRRFDRLRGDPNHRVHTHTLSGLLHVGFRDEGWDYDHLLRATRELTRGNVLQLEAAWRRMLFNVLAHNQDDHAKNFSFLMDDEGDWSLAPAYDLIFARSLHRGQAMMINGKRLFGGEDLVELGRKHSIEDKHMREIYEQVAGAVSEWRRYAAKAEVSPGRIEAIQGGLNGVHESLGFNEALNKPHRSRKTH